TRTAVELVRPGTADEQVAIATPGQPVVAIAADQDVRAAAAGDGIAARASVEDRPVRHGSIDRDGVVAVLAVDDHVAGRTELALRNAVDEDLDLRANLRQADRIGARRAADDQRGLFAGRWVGDELGALDRELRRNGGAGDTVLVRRGQADRVHADVGVHVILRNPAAVVVRGVDRLRRRAVAPVDQVRKPGAG